MDFTTVLMCSGIISNHFIRNFAHNVLVKKLTIGQYLAKKWTKVCGLLFHATLYTLTLVSYTALLFASLRYERSARGVKNIIIVHIRACCWRATFTAI